MWEFFEQIKNSTFAWVVLSLVAFLSLGWTIYSHFSANKKKQFSAVFSSSEIIKHGKNKIQNLKLIFSGNEINNLTISRFTIWNSGNKLINSDDMVTGQGIEIYSEKNAKILDAQIIAEVEKANSFKIIESTTHNVSIGFKYVDSHEGIVVQVFHTGDNNSLHSRWKIKGGGERKGNSNTFKRGHKRLSAKADRNILAVMMCAETIIFFLWSFYYTFPFIVNNLISEKWSIILFARSWPELYAEIGDATFIFLGILWILICVMICMTIISIQKMFAIGVPAKLKLFALSLDDE